jgi:hypothetical protein
MGVKMTRTEFINGRDDIVRVIKRAKYDYMAAKVREPKVMVLSYYAALMLQAYSVKILGFPQDMRIKEFDGMRVVVLDDSEELGFTLQFAKEWD